MHCTCMHQRRWIIHLQIAAKGGLVTLPGIIVGTFCNHWIVWHETIPHAATGQLKHKVKTSGEAQPGKAPGRVYIHLICCVTSVSV